METIVRIVAGNGLLKRAELTRKQIDEYEEKYLAETIRLSDKNFPLKVTDPLSVQRNIIFEKMLPPFEYWLRDRLATEQANERKGA